MEPIDSLSFLESEETGSLNQKQYFELFNETYVLQRRVRENGIKVELGDKFRKVCRFCGESKPAVTFRKKAHVIPKQMGGKHCVNFFECDRCNHFFSLYESSLGAYLKPFRSVWKIPGYKGLPTYKHPATGLRIETVDDKVNIVSTKEGDPGFSIDYENNSATINILRDPYIPVHVFKALLRIALCLLDDDEVPHFWRAFNWLRMPNFDSSKLNCSIFGWYFDAPRIETEAFLFKRRIIELDHKAPEKVFVVRFGHIQYQMPIIFSDQDAALESSLGLKWSTPVYPILLPAIEGRPPEISQFSPINLNSLTKRTDDSMDLIIASDEPMKRDKS